MVTSSHLLTYVKAEPFHPFRLHMASGRAFDVRHPEMIKVLKSIVLIFSFNAAGTELTDKMESVSLMLIESVSHLDAVVAN